MTRQFQLKKRGKIVHVFGRKSQCDVAASSLTVKDSRKTFTYFVSGGFISGNEKLSFLLSPYDYDTVGRVSC